MKRYYLGIGFLSFVLFLSGCSSDRIARSYLSKPSNWKVIVGEDYPYFALDCKKTYYYQESPYRSCLPVKENALYKVHDP